MLLFLALVACSAKGPACPDDSEPEKETGCPVCEDTDAPCDTGLGLAPQPNQDYLAAYNPSVVRTVPQAGDQAVDPGLEEIRVSFSKDMRNMSWSWVQISNDSFPESSGAEYVDERTNVLHVTLEPDHVYVIWVNSENYTNFKDTYGLSAVPYLLTFGTAEEG